MADDKKLLDVLENIQAILSDIRDGQEGLRQELQKQSGLLAEIVTHVSALDTI
jgi:hypothetical protein